MELHNQNRDELLKMASQRLGTTPENLEKTAGKNGEKLLSKLSEEDRKKVSEVLSNKELTSKILSTPKAKELLKQLFGDKKDGN